MAPWLNSTCPLANHVAKLTEAVLDLKVACDAATQRVAALGGELTTVRRKKKKVEKAVEWPAESPHEFTSSRPSEWPGGCHEQVKLA